MVYVRFEGWCRYNGFINGQSHTGFKKTECWMYYGESNEDGCAGASSL